MEISIILHIVHNITIAKLHMYPLGDLNICLKHITRSMQSR